MLAGVNSAADDEARCSLNNLLSHSCLQRSHPCRNPVVEAEGDFLFYKDFDRRGSADPLLAE